MTALSVDNSSPAAAEEPVVAAGRWPLGVGVPKQAVEIGTVVRLAEYRCARAELPARRWARGRTTPAGVARALTEHSASRGVRYRWRPARCGDRLADVCDAVAAGWPVAMLIGAVLPRHWVLLTEIDGAVLRCYEPSSGDLMDVPIDDIRHARLSRLGFPRPFAFVVPRLSA
jgi:hypothetical protein